MALYQFHYVLVVASIVFDAGFTFFCFLRWQRQGNMMDIVMGVVSTMIAILFVLYLFSFRRKMKRLAQLQKEAQTQERATQA